MNIFEHLLYIYTLYFCIHILYQNTCA